MKKPSLIQSLGRGLKSGNFWTKRKGRIVVLDNELALVDDMGRESLIVDPTLVTFPVASKYLLWERGSAYQYAQLCTGGSTLATMPLGPSPDAPYQASDILTVERLGARPGTQFGYAATAITIDHLVCATAAGLVADLTTIANGTYWVVGRATKTIAVGSVNLQISYVPVFPYLLINTGGTLTVPANPL